MSQATAPPTSPPGPPRGGRVLRIVNPATGEALRDLAEDSPEALARKVEKARRAQAEWARTPLDQRRKAIAVFAGLLEKNKDDLAARLTSEMGKPITQSRNELTA
ncbi:MAG TPA: aldehyde dehydrogenase family protein, partial [Vicinamibacteria bacterium]|nr:aldehyde dehydrogenase family protein [Vicinamibacteria bacterium]